MTTAEAERIQRDLATGERVFRPSGARPPLQIVKTFIDGHRERFGVEPIYQQLQVAPSAYRRHVAGQRNPELRCARAQRDEMLIGEIERVWQVNLPVYGADKVGRQLNREGLAVARCTVERLMRQQGLRGAMRGKPVKTTRPDPAAPCPLDRVNRQFSATRPNQLWVADWTTPDSRVSIAIHYPI